MNFISLFSGIGGFDLGLESIGMTCLAQVEIDKAARGVLATHYPHVERLNDVTKANKSNLPTVDLICGGFPCQDLSVAGRRAGLDGERSGLWFEFARIIGELKPSWVLIENVPGLLSSNDGQDFKIILDGLVERGYGVCWRILDAQYFGLAQRRKRLFIVASLGNGRSAQVLFEREGMSGDIETGSETQKRTSGNFIHSVANSLTTEESLRGPCGDGADNLVIGTLGAEHGRNRGLGNANETDFLVPFSKQRSDEYSQTNVGSTLAARDYKDNGDLVIPMAFNGHASSRQALQAFEDMTPTLAASNGTPLDVMSGQGVRRLTPTECERLQGFPDTWTAMSSGKPQADSARYKQLGNAVAAPVISWIGKRIMEAHK